MSRLSISSFLKRTFSHVRAASRPATPRSTRLGAELLEGRDLMSLTGGGVTAFLDGKVLTVQGTKESDFVRAYQSGSRIIVEELITGGGAPSKTETVGGLVIDDGGISTQWVQRGNFAASKVKAMLVEAGSGNDSVTLSPKGMSAVKKPATLYGQKGNDKLVAGTGDTKLYGGSPSDRPSHKDGRDVLIGGAGDDYLSGGTEDDILDDTAGRNTLLGGAGRDKLYGGIGPDKLDGGSGDDRLYDGAGDDTLYGGDGNDYLAGGGNNDVLDGGTGSDRVFGGSGADKLYGGDGNDALYGGAGDDWFSGGVGHNVFVGQGGRDLAEDVYRESGGFALWGDPVVTLPYVLNEYTGLSHIDSYVKDFTGRVTSHFSVEAKTEAGLEAKGIGRVRFGTRLSESGLQNYAEVAANVYTGENTGVWVTSTCEVKADVKIATPVPGLKVKVAAEYDSKTGQLKVGVGPRYGMEVGADLGAVGFKVGGGIEVMAVYKDDTGVVLPNLCDVGHMYDLPATAPQPQQSGGGGDEGGYFDQLGGKISGGLKSAGEALSNAWKDAGGAASEAWKSRREELEDWLDEHQQGEGTVGSDGDDPDRDTEVEHVGESGR